MATEEGIAIKAIEKVIEEGWEGKAKYALEVLWELGIINSNMANPKAQNKMLGKINGAGDPIKETSLN